MGDERRRLSQPRPWAGYNAFLFACGRNYEVDAATTAFEKLVSRHSNSNLRPFRCCC